MTLRIWVIQSKRSRQAKGCPENWTGLFLIKATCGLEQAAFQVLLENNIFFKFFLWREKWAYLYWMLRPSLCWVKLKTSLRFPADLPGWNLHQGLRFMHCIWNNTSIVRGHLISSWDIFFFLNVLEMRHQWWSLNSESRFPTQMNSSLFPVHPLLDLCSWGFYCRLLLAIQCVLILRLPLFSLLTAHSCEILLI